MDHPTGKMSVRNDSTRPLLLFVEPWGRDYWLQPNETFEFIATSTEFDENFYFGVDYGVEQIKVWAEGQCHDVLVTHNGQELECGHNRPPGYFS